MKMNKSICLAVLLLFAMPTMAQNTETDLFYPAEYAIEDVEKLTAVRRQVYQNGVRLTPDEVRGLMAGTEALRLYNQGLLRNRVGNILILCGVGAIAVGGIWGYLDQQRPESFGPSLVIGLSMGVLVAGYLVPTGLIFKSTSRRPIRTAVNMHNHSAHTSSVEFNFGFTQNGIGMVVRF